MVVSFVFLLLLMIVLVGQSLFFVAFEHVAGEFKHVRDAL